MRVHTKNKSIFFYNVNANVATSNYTQSSHWPMEISAMQSVLSGLSSKLLTTRMECNIHMHEVQAEFGSTQRLPWRYWHEYDRWCLKNHDELGYWLNLKKELVIFFSAIQIEDLPVNCYSYTSQCLEMWCLFKLCFFYFFHPNDNICYLGFRWPQLIRK